MKIDVLRHRAIDCPGNCYSWEQRAGECQFCGMGMHARRSDTTTCSTRCRMALMRKRRRDAAGGGS